MHEIQIKTEWTRLFRKNGVLKEWWLINRICIVGRLTQRPELRYTQSNIAYARFTVAVNRQKREDGTQEADFINCVAWNKQAENITNYLDKGSRVAVDGRLQTSTYERQDGSKGYLTEVCAQNVEFLESKKDNRPEPVTPQDIDNNRTDPFADFGEAVSIDDNFLD